MTLTERKESILGRAIISMGDEAYNTFEAAVNAATTVEELGVAVRENRKPVDLLAQAKAKIDRFVELLEAKGLSTEEVNARKAKMLNTGSYNNFITYYKLG